MSSNDNILLQTLSDQITTLSTDMKSMKADMVGMKADMVNLKTELKTDMVNLKTELKTDIVNLKTELKTDMVNLNTELKTELKTDMVNLNTELKSTLTRLEYHNPAIAASHIAKHVVQASSHHVPTVDGTEATWTWVTDGTATYAIGALHCALWYRSFDARRLFVALPEHVVAHGVKCVGVLKGLHELELPLCSACDMAIVEVHNTNNIIAQQLPKKIDWKATGACHLVIGKSNSCMVHGEGPIVQKKNKALSFVEFASEPGNSGTLMYAVCVDKFIPVGVFIGSDEAGDGARPRGQICPLPSKFPGNFTRNFVLHAARAVRPNTKLTLQDNNGTFQVSATGGGVLRKHEKIHGVFIDGSTHYAGYDDKIASRKRPRSSHNQ